MRWLLIVLQCCRVSLFQVVFRFRELNELDTFLPKILCNLRIFCQLGWLSWLQKRKNEITDSSHISVFPSLIILLACTQHMQDSILPCSLSSTVHFYLRPHQLHTNELLAELLLQESMIKQNHHESVSNMQPRIVEFVSKAVDYYLKKELGHHNHVLEGFPGMSENGCLYSTRINSISGYSR